MNLSMRASLEVPRFALESGDLPDEALEYRKEADLYELEPYKEACKMQNLPIAIDSQSADPFEDFRIANKHGFLRMMNHLYTTNPKILTLLKGHDHTPWHMLLCDAYISAIDQECRDWLFSMMMVEKNFVVYGYELMLSSVCTTPNPQFVEQMIELLRRTEPNDWRFHSNASGYNSITEEDADSLVPLFEALRKKHTSLTDFWRWTKYVAFSVDSVQLLEKYVEGSNANMLEVLREENISGSRIMSLFCNEIWSHGDDPNRLIPSEPEGFVDYLELCEYECPTPKDTSCGFISPRFPGHPIDREKIEEKCQKLMHAGIGEKAFIRLYGWMETNNVTVDPETDDLDLWVQLALRDAKVVVMEYLCETRMTDIRKMVNTAKPHTHTFRPGAGELQHHSRMTPILISY